MWKVNLYFVKRDKKIKTTVWQKGFENKNAFEKCPFILMLLYRYSFIDKIYNLMSNTNILQVKSLGSTLEIVSFKIKFKNTVNS